MSEMREMLVSAPGKVILHGEHAVVYGKRALAASLNIRTYVKMVSSDENIIHLNLPDIGVEKSWNKLDLQTTLELPLCDVRHPQPASDEVITELKKLLGLGPDTTNTKSLALVVFLYLYCSITPKDRCLPAVSILVSSNLPPSAGLGSSAAYSSCLATALLGLVGLVPTSHTEQGDQCPTTDQLKLINQWAFQAEKIIHGNPSGIDNSVSTYGGALAYQGGAITPLAFVPELDILLSNTNIPRSTKVLVAGVRAKYNKYPNIIGPVIESIEAISKRCEALFQEMAESTTSDHYNTLKDLISMNQYQLAVLGVSHPSLDDICHVTSSLGLPSKLTGAGGGGCAFTIIPQDVEPRVVKEAETQLQAKGYTCWRTVIGGPGVRIHSSLNHVPRLPPHFTGLL